MQLQKKHCLPFWHLPRCIQTAVHLERLGSFPPGNLSVERIKHRTGRIVRELALDLPVGSRVIRTAVLSLRGPAFSSYILVPCSSHFTLLRPPCRTQQIPTPNPQARAFIIRAVRFARAETHPEESDSSKSSCQLQVERSIGQSTLHAAGIS